MHRRQESQKDKRMPSSNSSSTGERAALEAELASLRQAQRAALERSAFIKMNVREQHEYEYRAQRVTEITSHLARDHVK
jgi:hypothetical protein